MLKVAREPFDVRLAVQETAEAALKAAQRNGNTIELDLPSRLPHLEADVARVKQVLSYLLGNAVKFTRGGTIRIRVTPVPERGTNWMRFEVRDTGIGIPPDVARNLFEDFMQADTSDSRKYDGTGLGLALGRRLARMMGGDITLDSTPGKGTVAALVLPLPDRADAAAGLTEDTASPDSWSI